MKRFLIALALLLVPTIASAQCNGVFPNNTVCGNVTGSPGVPRSVPISVFPISGSPVNKSYYVSTAGNDSNDGLSWATPKLTIQAALNAAATAGDVFIGVGTYTLTTPLLMRPGVRMICNSGAIITQGNGQNLAVILDFSTNSANGAIVEQCIIDGNRSGNTDNVNAFCVAIGTANDVVINYNTIRNCTGYGIWASSGLRPVITNNSVTNCYVAGIAHITGILQASAYTRIEGNRIQTPGQHATMIVNADNAIVRNNFILGSMIGKPGSLLRVSTAGTTVTWQSGPNFSTVLAGSFLVINGGAEFLVTSVADSTHLVVNNTPGTLNNVLAAIGTGDLITIDGSSNGIYTGNNVSTNATQGISVSSNSGGEATQKNIIANNIVTFAGEYCIGLSATINPLFDTSIVGNNISDCGQSGAADGGGAVNVGINVNSVGGSAVATNTLIDGNVVKDDQMTPTMNYWLAIMTNPAGSVIVGNNAYIGTVNNTVFGDVISTTLDPGWGSTAAVSNILSQGNSIQLTITANGTGFTVNPVLTISKIATISGSPTIICAQVSGNININFAFGEQNSSGGSWVLVSNTTPVAGQTFIFSCK